MTVNVDKQWFLDRMVEQGLNLSEVARRMGIDKSALSRALDGKRQVKPLEIGKIATNLRATREEVILHLEGIANNAAGGEEDRPTKGTAGEKPVVRRVKKGSSESADVSAPTKPGERRPLHPGIGFMKGLIKIEPGFDVTAPFSDESWEDGYLGEDRLTEGTIRTQRR